MVRQSDNVGDAHRPRTRGRGGVRSQHPRTSTSVRPNSKPPADHKKKADRNKQSPGDDLADPFVCDAALPRLPAGGTCLIAVVETRCEPDSGLFGYAWVTKDGQLRTAKGHSFGACDSAMQAMCHAALNLDNPTTRVHLVCRNAKAVSVVSRVLRSGVVPHPDSVGFPVSDDTYFLLVQLAERRDRISVCADGCQPPHRGAAVAAHLAALSLAAGKGLEDGRKVAAEADRIARELSRRVKPFVVQPGKEREHTRWRVGPKDDRTGRGQLIWETALHRMHIEGEWCPLPAGRVRDASDGRRLRLRIEHQDYVYVDPRLEQDVTLRRRGGEWEIHGIHWPEAILPGVVVTFRWRPRTPLVIAHTQLLPRPERVDGVEFLHRYDPQVVTREIAPGSDQDRSVPTLSDKGWVLRTLRKLGYLSADGSATLAEEALIRNCVRLGFPARRVDGLADAVKELQRTGQIQRVVGGIDQDGRPWYPHRPGQTRVPLLRYVPRVEALDPSIRREIHDAWQAHRRGHWVSGFIRRLPSGAQASAEQIELHREAVYAAEVVDQPLPEGYTYVRRHRRGRSRGGN